MNGRYKSMNANPVDVTSQVEFVLDNSVQLPVTRCACGEAFEKWHFTLGMYRETPTPCPKCGRKFYWRPSAKVYEVKE
jgi:hypothetical protein